MQKRDVLLMCTITIVIICDRWHPGRRNVSRSPELRCCSIRSFGHYASHLSRQLSSCWKLQSSNRKCSFRFCKKLTWGHLSHSVAFHLSVLCLGLWQIWCSLGTESRFTPALNSVNSYVSVPDHIWPLLFLILHQMLRNHWKHSLNNLDVAFFFAVGPEITITSLYKLQQFH